VPIPIGWPKFIIKRAITAALVLVIVIVISTLVISYSVCSRITGIMAELRLQINNEIESQHLKFTSFEDRNNYVEKRVAQEIKKMGLEVCV